MGIIVLRYYQMNQKGLFKLRNLTLKLQSITVEAAYTCNDIFGTGKKCCYIRCLVITDENSTGIMQDSNGPNLKVKRDVSSYPVIVSSFYKGDTIS